MASRGPRSKLDHETRAKRQKVLEVAKEPRRPKTHWDHVLEEMAWLSKDFESERKWKLAQAKKVAMRASRCILDQASRGERRMKEEEQRVRKVALNITKEIKKFWIKIEKLVLYKHQLELEERKKKALDKQLDFLLGQTERYSTMLAENLVHTHSSNERLPKESGLELSHSDQDSPSAIGLDESLTSTDVDHDYGFQSEDESEDDEHTIEEDEALITEDERREELAALHDEVDLPLEELLARYAVSKEAIPGCDNGHISDILDEECQASGHASDSPHGSPLDSEGEQIKKQNMTEYSHSPNALDPADLSMELTMQKQQHVPHLKRLTLPNRDYLPIGFTDEADDHEYIDTADEEKDDETTLSEEEELAMKEVTDPLDEIILLQNESEIPLEELVARYKKDGDCDSDDFEMEAGSSSYSSGSSDGQHSSPEEQQMLPVSPHISFDSMQTEMQNLFEVESLQSKSEVAKEMDNEADEEREAENIIADAAAAARSAQPTGITFSTTKVRTKFPFLLKHPLREYQHIGLDWLVTMYEKRLNGILADEMGLGKTIMTISLLAHLACEKGIWGPHLIVVPTSVMLNWETEFLKWCPAFKILTYFGNAKERKLKRQGWLKPNSFHVCITTYRLVIQDSKVFKRKKWKYLILDEAHLIKNWKSQRWQTLLNFNSKRRILLTGTPLQNDLMELWSLMHFLMPHIFQSHQEFKDWFSNPITCMVEGHESVNKDVVDRLHNVLRPFLLRRLKSDVEKQLPKKQEHVIYCRLSRRQRNLYEDFIASSETQATLASGNFFGMISVIMQLRKVCNHPDLFEGRPILSSFDMAGIDMQLSSSMCNIFSLEPFYGIDMKVFNLTFSQNDFNMPSWAYDEITALAAVLGSLESGDIGYGLDLPPSTHYSDQRKFHGSNIFQEVQKSIWEERLRLAKERASAIAWWNSLRCQKRPVYGTDLIELVSVRHPVLHIDEQKNSPSSYMEFSSKLADLILTPLDRLSRSVDLVEQFMFAIPAARAPSPVCWCSKPFSPIFLHPTYEEQCIRVFSPLLTPIRPAIIRRQVYFPDRRLIQFDCGKLQELAVLLRRLKSEGHRALIFTQMTKMLDILEAFINLYGYTYMRLDGSTQPEDRQTLMQRFNTNPKYFLFILSTRSGGVGINLVGADTVIFYDSDWNPAMDQQAQDRCHRIGQTREVHIYRLISESTIEENILKKANQKRALDNLVIQSGSYNTEFFKKLNPMELFSGQKTVSDEGDKKGCSDAEYNAILSNADVEAALRQAEDEADYMALKKVEQEEAVENQEFAEEAIGKIEDDELVNDDDIKPDDVVNEEPGCLTSIASMDNPGFPQECNMTEDKALTLTERDEDIDMLADVKQMAAAAAAAGQSYSLLEDQLRPIDRYAMRFLDLWDPIIDKSEVQNEVSTDKEDWELDRIQKLKEEMEAEMDDDEEPFVYKTWDAEFATEAYKQQVEALAQQQLLEELESEAADARDVGLSTTGVINDEELKERKSKIRKKKMKKAKFKSLKKGSLASDTEEMHEDTDKNQEPDADEISAMMDVSQDSPSRLSSQKKRKFAATEDEKASRKASKKSKKSAEMGKVDSASSDRHIEQMRDWKSSDGVADVDPKLTSRSKMGGKISISPMPVKRIMVVKQEKLKKKGNFGFKDVIPSPDAWASQEDAVLCAAVHEYGTNWNLVVDLLYSMTAGGYFRGRFRHPFHCCERFRELFFKYILRAPDSPNIDKISAYGSGKAPLKVTEDQVDILLNAASDLPNNELLLQKHFAYLLSAAWRMKHRFDNRHGVSTSHSGLYTFKTTGSKSQRLTENMHPAALRQCSEVVANALSAVNTTSQEGSPMPQNQQEISPEDTGMELTVEIPEELASACLFPSMVKLSFAGRVTQLPDTHLDSTVSKVSKGGAEERFRATWETCIEGETPQWTSSTFCTSGNARSRISSKLHSSGKQKPPTDSVKPLKSKLSKIVGTNDESKSIFHGSLSESLFSELEEGYEALSTNLNVDANSSLLASVDTPVPELLNSRDLVFDHDPSVIDGLVDFDLSADITEFGL